MGKITSKTVEIGDKPTATEIAEVEAASRQPIVFDEDSPDYSYEELLEMKKAADERRNARKKEVVTLRLPASVLNKAKATGKGYTGFLSRLIENAMNDKDLVTKSL